MIDLHIHSKLSTGSLNVNAILDEIESKNLNYFSITDINHALAYQDIDLHQYDNLIVGTEFVTSIDGVIIEILAYDINSTMVNNWFYDYFNQNSVEKIETKLFTDLLKIMDRNNIKYSDNLQLSLIEQGIAKSIVYHDILKNNDDLPFDNFSDYYRNYLSNPFSAFYLDESTAYPSIETILDLITKAGGKAFLAHPYEYNLSMERLINVVIDKELDGIEVFHPSASLSESLKILKFCEDNDLLASGGSDFHHPEDLNSLGIKLDEEIKNSKAFQWIKER